MCTEKKHMSKGEGSGKKTATVAIITRDRSSLINRALESIACGALLPDEILIIDDGSHDSTREIIREYICQYPFINVRIFYEPRTGRSSSRNRALDEAQGDIIAFTDDDCIVDVNWLDALVTAHDCYPEAIAIGGNTLNLPNGMAGLVGHVHRQFMTWRDMVDSTSAPGKVQVRFPEEPTLMISLATQNIAYKRAKIRGYRFNERLSITEAVDFSWQIFKNNPQGILFFPDAIVWHEYVSTPLELMRLHFEYGSDSYRLHREARMGSYLPSEVIDRKGRFSRSFAFTCKYMSTEKLGLIKRGCLLALIALKESSGAFGYIRESWMDHCMVIKVEHGKERIDIDRRLSPVR